MKRGFTLIETMVAIVMALIITSVALSLLVQISRIQLRDSIMQSLKREGQFIGLTLTSSLRVAGFGVPRGSDINFGVATTTALLTATPTAVGILGDAPAPGTQYNTFGILHTRNFDEPSDPTSVHRDRFSFHNENNGSCVPLGCDTADTSVFFPGESGCDTTALYDDRVCPWGLRRLESGDRYQIVAGDGGWTGGSMGPSPGLVSIPAPAAPDDWFTDDAILLDTGVDYDDVLGVWGNSGPGDAPTNTPGIGWVTTLDRIYFYRRGTAAPYQLIRRQCWGDPRFDEANFILANGDLPPNPQAATNFNATTHGCTAPEVLADNVDSFDLTYSADTLVAASVATEDDRNDIRLVNYSLVLAEDHRGQHLTHEVRGTVALRNLIPDP